MPYRQRKRLAGYEEECAQFDDDCHVTEETRTTIFLFDVFLSELSLLISRCAVPWRWRGCLVRCNSFLISWHVGNRRRLPASRPMYDVSANVCKATERLVWKHTNNDTLSYQFVFLTITIIYGYENVANKLKQTTFAGVSTSRPSLGNFIGCQYDSVLTSSWPYLFTRHWMACLRSTWRITVTTTGYRRLRSSNVAISARFEGLPQVWAIYLSLLLDRDFKTTYLSTDMILNLLYTSILSAAEDAPV